MNDYESGQAYSRAGGRLHPGQTVSSDFYNGVRSNEIQQENIQHLSQAWQSPAPNYAGSGGGGRFAGLLVFIGVILLFISPPFGLLTIGAGIVIGLLQSLSSLLRSKLFWFAVIVLALFYFSGHHPHH